VALKARLSLDFARDNNFAIARNDSRLQFIVFGFDFDLFTGSTYSLWLIA
jgi:hypothetical protein